MNRTWVGWDRLSQYPNWVYAIDNRLHFRAILYPRQNDVWLNYGGQKRATDSKAGVSTDTKAGDTKSATDAKAATAAPPAEKQSQIATAIKSEKVEEVTNVNFNISIGATVPTTVRYYPLPPRIIEIYPEWRGYVFILVRGKYIILRPQTHEIVYIIEG